MARIGIILGSTRNGRNGEVIAQWLLGLAQDRDIEYTLIDLKSFDVPVYEAETLPMMANKSYDDPRVQAWSDAVDACDAFVFVTPEYNHSVPGPFKNAFDSLGREWQGKPLAYVGYSYTGGIRAVEAWRLAAANFSMQQLRSQLEINLLTDFQDGEFAPAEFKAGIFQGIMSELEALL